MRNRSSSSKGFRFSFRKIRGAALAEYLPIISIGLLVGTVGVQEYGGVVREHIAEFSEQIASNYYKGWFYPDEDEYISSHGGGTGNPSTGGPTDPGDPSDPQPGDPTDPGNSPNPGEDPPPVFNPLPSDPVGGGPMCPDGGASGGAAPSAAPINTFAGNPINFGNGNKHQAEHDYRHYLDNPLVFTRYYNSLQQDQSRTLGYGWQHSYQRHLRIEQQESDAQRIHVFRDDGAYYRFNHEDERWFADGVVDRLTQTDNGWRYTTVQGAIETYDADGRLQSIQYTGGTTHTLTYRDTRLQRVEDSRGPALKFEYNASGTLEQVTLPGNLALHFDYDTHGNLSGYQKTDRSAWQSVSRILSASDATYHYEHTKFPHALTGITDADDKRFATWDYDALGRAILSRHGGKTDQIKIAYNKDGTVTTTNAMGLHTTYHLEQARPGYRRLVRVEGQATPTCPNVREQHEYDDNGFLALAVDGENNALRMQRNARGLIEREEDGLTHQQGQWLPVEGSSLIERQWHTDLPLITEETHSRYHQGQWQSYRKIDHRYDPAGRRTSTIHTDLSQQSFPYSSYGDTRTWTYSYTENPSLPGVLESLSINGPRAAAEDGSDDTYHYTFNDQGQIARITNPLGHTTEIDSYDTQGNPTAARLANSLSIKLRYDVHGRMQSLTRQSAEKEIRTQFEHNPNGTLKQISFADDSWQRYTYNDARQLIAVHNNWGEILYITPGDISGNWATQEVYNAQGQLVRKSHRILDSLGRIHQLIGNHGQQTKIDYTRTGQLKTITQQGIDNPSQRHYDSLDRLVTSIDALQGKTQIDYSLQGPVAQVTDAEGSKTRYIHNGFGEIIWRGSDANGESTYWRDPAGNIVRQQSGENPNQTQWHYDHLNRLAKADYPGETEDSLYQYDQTDDIHGNGIGKLTALIDHHSRTDYQYSDLGQVTAEIRSFNSASKKNSKKQNATASDTQILRYGYNDHGALAYIQYNNGAQARYHYNKDRIESVNYIDNTGIKHPILDDIEYQAFAGPSAWQTGNGLDYRRESDLDGRITNIQLTNNGETVWQQQYEHDATNNITGIEKIEQGQSQQTSYSYSYDDLHRLTGEQRSATESIDSYTTSYTYDGVGNRLSKVHNSQKTTYEYAKGNRLISWEIPQSEKPNNPINQGLNQTKESRGLPIQTAQQPQRSLQITGDGDLEGRIHNQKNRLVAYFKNGKRLAEYRYTGNGQRIEKQLQAKRTRYQYLLTTQLAQETEKDKAQPQKTIETHYLWLGSTPIALIKSNTGKQVIVYLHADHLNTPKAGTGKAGEINWRWESNAFGMSLENPTVSLKDQVTINLRFPGQYYDQESGLHYNYFRDYDPVLGRYIQSDPIGLRGGINLHNYVKGNPVRLVDKLGLMVTAVLDTSLNQLSVYDNDTGDKYIVAAFTGGHIDPETGAIISPGTGKEQPAPKGNYYIVDNPNPIAGREDWFGLFYIDERVDDYLIDGGEDRSGIRLHGGGISHGCVTVNNYTANKAEHWNNVHSLIHSTKTETLEFIQGPHFWNPKGETNFYGVLTIK
ncbi:RHS repeat-associated core domain-containing protein [uncultured Microbulbifer sp.]|uniref:RHS repeat-associated core domain-containing protein n=1 Tax=uncultured Microbulbifer sp. TaxID=348147 RepID=UPI002621FA2A|nr:RHS repeat-associated core domain-containing protein [uncultured Microbulbifer sp.]